MIAASPTPAQLPPDPALRLDGIGSPLYVLDTSRGLVSNQVHRLARDTLSRLWLASPVGLACFDGSFVHHWDRRQGLHCNGLRCVAVDVQDNIWIGTDLGLESIDRLGQLRSDCVWGDWSYGLCQKIDARGSNPWIGAALGLVRLRAQDEGSGLRVDFAADVGYVSDLLRITEQRVLAASSVNGLIETDGKTWWTYRCKELVGRLITRIASGPDGELLVGTDDGLFIINDTDSTVTAVLRVDGENPQVGAVVGAADRYWVAFGQLLVAIAGNSTGFRVAESFRLDSTVNDLLLDESGDVWIATNNSGLAKVSCLRHAMRRIDLGRTGGIYAISPGPQESYWIGGEGLCGRADFVTERGSAVLSQPEGLPATTVWDYFEDETGAWAATQSGLFHAAPGARFTHLYAADPVIGAPNRVLMPRNGELWVGSLRGLARIRAGACEAFDGEGAPLGYVYAMSLDASGALWIGTLGRGLWREQQGLQRVCSAELREDGNTYAVVQGPDGRTLVIQDERVVVFDPALPARRVAELPPVAGWAAAWLNERTIAVGASDGLRILDLASGTVTRHIQALFRLREWEFTNSRTLVVDPHGGILCGLSSGLVRVDLGQLSVYSAPRCRLVDLVWTGAEPERRGPTYRLRPGRWSFRVRAASGWMVDSAQLRFQFQLIGFDTDWLSPTDRPQVTFTSLPPGEYRLMVRAHSPLSGTGPEAELLHLIVSQPAWAMGWSAAIAAIESIYDWFVASRQRNAILLERNRALERAVAERTNSLLIANRELEAVSGAFQRLSEVDELTQLGNRRNFEKEIDRAMALADRLQLPLALLMVDIDFFKAANDRYGHQTGDDYLREVGKVLAANTRKGEGVATRYGGEEFAILLNSSGPADALSCAQRVRNGVIALALPNERSPTGILTVSIGIAIIQPGQALSKGEFIAAADRALYRAKNNGRDQIALPP